MASRLRRIALSWLTAWTRLLVRATARAVRAVTDHLSLVYHVVVVVLSAAIASTLPVTFTFLAQQLLASWSAIQDERIFLVSTEVAVALVLVLLAGHARTTWTNRRVAGLARAAGIVHKSSESGILSRRAARRLKERHALMHDIMIIGSTGFRTLVDPRGDLHAAIASCRTARVMLLDPVGPGALERARTIGDPEITPERLRAQVELTIAFLRTLPAAHRRVRLKLYPDPPLWKLAVLGDRVWVRHYHPTRDVRLLPEYVFAHRRDAAGLYAAFYHYFVARWNDPAIPEYDLLTGERVGCEGVAGEAGRGLSGQEPR